MSRYQFAAMGLKKGSVRRQARREPQPNWTSGEDSQRRMAVN